MNLPSKHDRATPPSLPCRAAAKLRFGVLALSALLALAPPMVRPRGHRDKTRNTLIGAGIGAAGGALISHGDVWGTLGGAAAGGLIGNAISNDGHHRRDRDRRDRDRRDWRNDRHYHPLSPRPRS